MVKIFLSLLIFFNFLYSNVYEKNCVNCHKKLPVSIDKYFYRYLLKHSSEKNVKKAMFDYLKNPNKKNTLMPQAFIKRFGIKKRSKLKDEELLEALEIYWEKYKIFGKLK